ncbi:hypothetical protein DPMN_058362 [Dreissena polymorpha]|uniref:Uncharacterized protein n=1 Tax=Dreissena polymorpha TaxID=45954 RepID=A0A9D4C1V8_DREPO|nr:hypothetical protein DPMN_058362 [Dreissena polymorpha]
MQTREAEDHLGLKPAIIIHRKPAKVGMDQIVVEGHLVKMEETVARELIKVKIHSA